MQGADMPVADGFIPYAFCRNLLNRHCYFDEFFGLDHVITSWAGLVQSLLISHPIPFYPAKLLTIFIYWRYVFILPFFHRKEILNPFGLCFILQAICWVLYAIQCWL